MSERDLFVSYGTRDAQAIAEDIVGDLEARGVVCWIAPRDIPAGSRSWASEIVKGIRSSRNFLLLLSRGANASEEIEKELDEAARQRKPLFVLRIEDIEPSEGLGYHLNRVQWRDLFRNRDVALNELVARTLALRAASDSLEQSVSTDVSTATMPAIVATSLPAAVPAPDAAERNPLRYAVVAVLVACALLVAGLWLSASPTQEIAAVVVPAIPAAPVVLAVQGPAAAPLQSETSSLPGSPAPPAGVTPPVASAATPAELSDQAFAEALGTRLALLYPKRSNWTDRVVYYVGLSRSRGLAVAPPDATWNAAGWPSDVLAEEYMLEACQVRYDRPCEAVAIGNRLLPLSAAGTLPARDMPRVGYAGSFDPERIPAVSPGVRRRNDVLSFAGSSGSKAIVLDQNNLLYVVSGAASALEAERRAFALCNGDPRRQGLGGVCLLYATGLDVVLPRRAIGPIAASSEASDKEVALIRAILAANPATVEAAQRAQRYLAAPRDRALAASTAASETWFASAAPSELAAREWALERCELRFAKPCGLLALNEALVPFRVSPMPRIGYAGSFDPASIPVVTEERRLSREVQNYRSAPGFKAAAIHPWGRIFLANAAVTQRGAEETALSACNGDQARAGREGPCFLYASGTDIVLARRAVAALTAGP